MSVKLPESLPLKQALWAPEPEPGSSAASSQGPSCSLATLGENKLPVFEVIKARVNS